MRFRGLQVLNEFIYVMTPEGQIQSCKIGDPLTWPSLQFTTADYEDDPGIALGKFLNYIVAFGTYTIQFFYDAGNPVPGISISPYINANLRIGCAFASTVQNIKNTIIWVRRDIDSAIERVRAERHDSEKGKQRLGRSRAGSERQQRHASFSLPAPGPGILSTS